MEVILCPMEHEDTSVTHGLQALVKTSGGYRIRAYDGEKKWGKIGFLPCTTPRTAARKWHELTGLEAPSMAEEIRAFEEGYS